jgi:hypothetical protein
MGIWLDDATSGRTPKEFKEWCESEIAQLRAEINWCKEDFEKRFGKKMTEEKPKNRDERPLWKMVDSRRREIMQLRHLATGDSFSYWCSMFRLDRRKAHL